MKKIQFLIASAAIAFSAQAMAANVIINGDFGTGDFTGWTQFGNTGYTDVQDGYASFGAVGSVGGISQTVASAGTYNVSFDLGNDAGNSSLVEFGGNSLLSNVGQSGFTTYNFTVTVGAGSALSFSFQNDPSYYTLDNVVVEAVAGVPEPASWAMLIAGFGLTGAAMRRRRIAAAA